MDKKASQVSSLDNEVRKGPWTMEEDYILINYIANHGEGVWNSLARSAGLKRTGKSCRLRWLNYLRPDVRRGNITPDEELLIMELHAKWGNRWSKIAKHLPGRTDNEIKNYWRTRIQKHLKQAESSTNSRHDQISLTYSSDNNNNNNNHEIIPTTTTNTISALSTNNNIQNYVVSSSNDHHHHPPYLPSMDNPSSYHHHHHHHDHHDHHDEHGMDQISNIGGHHPQLHHPDQPFNWETTEEDLWSIQLFNTYNN